MIKSEINAAFLTQTFKTDTLMSSKGCKDCQI